VGGGGDLKFFSIWDFLGCGLWAAYRQEKIMLGEAMGNFFFTLIFLYFNKDYGSCYRVVATTSLYTRSNAQSEATRELRDGLLMYGKEINQE
jgi:hypothetical protein